MLGFVPRPSRKGSHHVYTKEGIPEIISLQPNGGMARAYQFKQVRDLILRHGL